MGADLWPDGTGLIRRPVEALAEGQEPAAPGAEQGDGGVRVTFINVMSVSHWKRLKQSELTYLAREVCFVARLPAVRQQRLLIF